jgi:molecular chaperone GrpE (heat shock protein)
MIDMFTLNMKSVDDNNSFAQLIIKKIEKKLNSVLAGWQVQEIVFEEGRIEPGKARVLETRKVSKEILAGTIVEICRKGYQRCGKTIRSADVITAGLEASQPNIF